MSARGKSTHIVQTAYKKCLEMHDFVLFSWKKTSGGLHQTPSPFSLKYIVWGVI